MDNPFEDRLDPLTEITRWAESREHRGAPPWGSEPAPDPRGYWPIECFMAGAISTQPPFDKYHPSWALPIARVALTALENYEPGDAA